MKLGFSLAVYFTLIGLFAVAPVYGQAGPAGTSEVIPLVTKDGVQIAITYYPSAEPPGTLAARQVTPVVMLHDLKDTRATFAAMAALLQSRGDEANPRPSFAVITVDLRGHGDSARQVMPNGEQQVIDPAKLNPVGLGGMVTFDMEAVRRWLVTKNDASEFNLNKLCLVGVGLGANVAANWAAQDWATPPLAVVKQGQDVKALVLISPRWTYRGLNMQGPMQLGALKQNAAWLLIYGAEDQEVRNDARRINDQLVRFHPETDVPGASGLRTIPWPTSLQGGKLLAQNGPAIEEQVLKFLIMHVAGREFPWISRRDRLP